MKRRGGEKRRRRVKRRALNVCYACRVSEAEGWAALTGVNQHPGLIKLCLHSAEFIILLFLPIHLSPSSHSLQIICLFLHVTIQQLLSAITVKHGP